MFGGGPGLKALACLRPGGILVSGQAVWTPGLHERAAELGVRARGYLVDPDAVGLEALTDLVRKGRLRVHIDKEFPLVQAAEAHHLIVQGRTTARSCSMSPNRPEQTSDQMPEAQAVLQSVKVPAEVPAGLSTASPIAQ